MSVKIVDVKEDSDLSGLTELELRTCKIHYKEYLPAVDAAIAIGVINKYLVRRHPVCALDFDVDEIIGLPNKERTLAMTCREKYKGRSMHDVLFELYKAGEIREDF